LLCPNHQSYIDAVILYAFLPGQLVRNTLFVAFGEIFSRAPLSWAIRPARIVATGGASMIAEALKLCYDGLNRNMSVCIFPEGGRSRTGEIMPPRPGAGILACETQTAIVPIRIKGADQTLSPINPGLHLCRITIEVGTPIEVPVKEDYEQKDYERVMGLWRNAINTSGQRKTTAEYPMSTRNFQ
jgi:1-acyl-sn-glycerol-3-phosphate acyltransferase